jgi:hypothetical protein
MPNTPATPASITSWASEPKARTWVWGSVSETCVRRRRRLSVGRAAGVEYKDGHPRRREELPQRGAVHQLAVALELRILEPEIAVLASAR